MKEAPKSPWPLWAPDDLKEAYTEIRKVPASKWVAMDHFDYTMKQFRGLKPAEYLVGVGKQSECLGIVERLGTDLRMKSVWARLRDAEAHVRSGKVVTFLTGRVNESVSCEVARACVRGMHSASNKPPVTRGAWKLRHKKIAANARSLAGLLRSDGFIEPELGSLMTAFSAKAFHDLSNEAYFHLGPHAYKELDISELDTERKQTEEEGATANAEWKEGAEQFEYWLQQAMTRGAPRLDKMLLHLSEIAETVARNPPFVGPTARSSREVFVLNGSLFTYFSRYAFRKPLDEVVATITEVVTGKSVSAEAVKTRRHRWMKHSSRPLR